MRWIAPEHYLAQLRAGHGYNDAHRAALYQPDPRVGGHIRPGWSHRPRAKRHDDKTIAALASIWA